MKKKITKKTIQSMLFIIALIIVIVIMILFIEKKNGWHEDEIFSYGSSNYKYDSLFQRYAYKDSFNQVMDETVMDENPIKTIKNLWYYFITNNDEFDKVYKEKQAEEHPIWKTPQDALDYVSVSSDEIFSYWSVYYNQSRDVHPPLFYMLVHLASSFYLNHFSKYIIFVINLAFFIGCCFIIRKILALFNKEHLSLGVILLYGLSMGGISIVLFQRMYMMLTFFVLTYLYLTLKIVKNQYQMDKKIKKLLILTTILGFLTQYYFCIYIALVAIICAIVMIKNKQWKELKDYIVSHMIAAIIGIALFPASIYHIFFSYRGVAGGVVETTYMSRLLEYLNKVFYAFSLPEIVGYMLIGALIILCVIQFIKARRKDIVVIMVIPVILFLFVIAKIAPFINIRYISPILPIIAIGIALIIQISVNWLLRYLNNIDRNSKIWTFCQQYLGLIVLLIIASGLSAYGFTHSEPEFLYSSYDKRVELAEKYKEYKLVYVGESEFSHLQDMEEFLRYNESLIINTNQLDVLKDDEVIQGENEYILNIKCWVSNFDETLEKVLEYTDAKDYELLLDDGESRIYKVYRSQ